MNINTDYHQYWALGQTSFCTEEELKKIVEAPVNVVDTQGLEALQLSENTGSACQHNKNTEQ